MSTRGQRANRLVDQLRLTPQEFQRLLGVLRVALDTVDDDYRANVAAIARDLGRSRRTIYNWADRILETTVRVLRDIRVGRPAKRGRA